MTQKFGISYNQLTNASAELNLPKTAITSLKPYIEPSMKIRAVLKSVAICAQRMHFTRAGRFILAASAAGTICAAGNVQAAQIQGVTIYDVSSQQYNYPSTATFSVTNLVSNIGLFGEQHAFVPNGCMWLSANGPVNTNYVTFNLGQLYTVNGMKVWNYNDSSFFSGSNGRVNWGLSNAVISYSTDGINFTTNVASQNFNRGHGNFTPYAQTIAFPSPVAAQYIRINVKSTWGGGGTNVGLAKVRFISNTNPPAVLSASENYGSNQVTVIFSEPVDTSTATNPSNYSISGSGPVAISGVTMGEYADRVILSTSPLTNNNYSVSVSGVYDEAVTAAVTNNSTVSVQAELYLWLKADQGVTTSSSIIPNMVTQWADQSSYGHSAESANFFGVLTNGPVLASGVVNGLPALQFFGTNVLQIPNDAANPINGDMTLFMVASLATTSGQLDPINKAGGGSSATSTNNLAAPFDFFFNGGNSSFLWGNNGANVSGNGANITQKQALSANTFYLVAVSVTATNLAQLVVNGSSPLTDLSRSPVNKMSAYLLEGGAPQDAGNPICIGARNNGASSIPFNGYLPEIMLVRGTITPSDFVKIENYLAAKYNIASPTVTEQPTSLTANAGSQATFWVGASGMQPFSYQWQSNSAPIPGATNASYTTPYLTTFANGANYTVTVSNACGTANSGAATLTVAAPTTGPTVFSAAKMIGLTNVLVVFSEAIDSGTGLNGANYSVDNSISVVSAAAGSSPSQVVLTTSPMNNNGLYHLAVRNVQDQYGNPMPVANVPIMPSSLTMWLRADSGVITNANAGNPSAVDGWLDQTANGNNAQTYGIANYRPSIGTDPVNGQPAVLFSSSANQFLVAPSSRSLEMTGDMSVYVMFNPSDNSAFHDLISKACMDSTLPAGYDLFMNSGGGALKWSRGDGSTFHNGVGTGVAIAAGKPVTLNIVHQGTGVQPEQGGTSTFYTNAAGAGSATFLTMSEGDFGSPVYIGMRGSFDLPMNGDIQEVMVFSNAISAADRTNIDNYFGGKYFTVTNTVLLTNETVNAGGSATFVAAPSQGPAHLTYQWLKIAGGVTNAIPGANGPTYTLSPVSTSDNGDQFALLVIAGSVTNFIGLSNSATPVTLTVNSVPPVVQNYGVAFWGTNLIVVTFQTPLNASIATNTANYSLDNGATVLSATLVSPTEVILTTSLLNPGTSYTLTVQNLQDQFGSIMATTNLVNVTTANLYPSNPALWLRADKSVLASGVPAQNGDSVSEWDDQSANGNNFIGDFGFEPTFVTNAVNGLPALLFNATNQTYLYNNSGSASLALTGDLTIFAVMNFTTYLSPSGQSNAPGGGEIISKNDPLNKNIPASYDYYVYYGGGQTPMLLRGNGTSSQVPFNGAANSPSTGVWHEFSAMSQASSSSSGLEYHRMDGHTNGAPIAWSVSGGVADTGGLVIIGERTDGNVRLTGYMAELIVFGSSMTASDEAAIETYLGTKYNLIVSPRLAISTTNANAVVSWQNPQWPFVLQSAPSLNGAAWTAVTNTPALINSTNAVTLPMGANPMFYRLKSQSQ